MGDGCGTVLEGIRMLLLGTLLLWVGLEKCVAKGLVPTGVCPADFPPSVCGVKLMFKPEARLAMSANGSLA